MISLLHLTLPNIIAHQSTSHHKIMNMIL